MSPEVIAAERAKEVRDAARAWRKAGFTSDGTLARILALYPDDRRRFGPGFMVLAFIFTGIAMAALVGLSFATLEPRGDEAAGALALAWAVILAILTEIQRGPMKRSGAGAESATAYLGALLGIVGLLLIDSRGLFDPSFIVRFLTVTLVVCAAAAWRWGDALFFLGAGVCGFLLLNRSSEGRWLWIAASTLLVPLCLRGARAPSLSPSHRRGATILGAVSLLALYAALHIWVFDQRGLEGMFRVLAPHAFGTAVAPPSLRPLFILATALLPLVLILTGWLRREPLLLSAGLITAGVSIGTVRLYYDLMPLSVALTLAGTACMSLALATRRWLRGGGDGERGGFTADPLFDKANRTAVIKSALAMASFTPAPRTETASPAFEGGGGRYGGGGATGNF